MPSPSIDNLVALIRLAQKDLSDDDRLIMWDEIKMGYCHDCGSRLTHANPACYCNKDD